jgi:hypothetical protein
VCKDCVKANVESNIANGEYPVRCPLPECRKPMEQADVRALAGDELFHQLEARMMGNVREHSMHTSRHYLLFELIMIEIDRTG